MATLTLEQTSLDTTGKQRFYRPELDVLRFGAFLLVLMHHTISNQGHGRVVLAIREAGSYGVSVFFLLSAYLITELLLREKEATGTVSLRRFYIRRILRIWPLYFGFLAIAFVTGHLVHRPETYFSALALAGALLLVGNFCAAHGLALGIAGALWSISVEEQFYLLWPFLARVLTRQRVVVAGLGLWAASQIVTTILIRKGVPYYPNLWLSSIPQVQYFALGMMLIGLRPVQIGPAFRTALAGAGLLTLFLAVDMAGPYLVFPVAGIGAALIFSAFLGASLPAIGPLQYLGKISYGLYVFHESCLLLTHIASHRIPFVRLHPWLLVYTVPLPLTIAIASLSYRYFETPFLRLKERFETVHSRPA